MQKLGKTSGVENVPAAKFSACAITEVAHADHARVSLGELALWRTLRLHARETSAFSCHTSALVAAKLVSLFAKVVG